MAPTFDFIDSLTIEINKLKVMRDYIKSDFHKAKREGMEANREVILWLASVDAVESKVTRINDELQNRWHLCGGCSPICHVHYKMHKKAAKLQAEASNLFSKGFSFQYAPDQLAVPPRFIEMPSTRTVGMQPMVDHLEALYEDDDVGIIGIYGMAGVGKTALLTKFHNEVLIDATELDLIIWINASTTLDIEGVQKAVADRLGLPWNEGKTCEERAVILFNTLIKKKFVLIIDGLWNPLDLQSTGIPIPKIGSKRKIILATRLENVCNQMDAKNIGLECLTDGAAWNLFEMKSGIDISSCDPRLRILALFLIAKCGGLPSVIITLARILAGKRTINEWLQVTSIFSSGRLYKLEGMEDQVLYPMKLSYDNLPNDKIRACLLHFCMFPNGPRIGTSMLSQNWDYEGLIDDYKDKDELEQKGSYILGMLREASLVEALEDYAKVHPIVSAMALWIACECGKKEDRYLMQVKSALEEAPKAERWIDAEKVSLAFSETKKLPDAPHSPHLIFLNLRGNENLEKIPDRFFSHMPILKVLDLGSTTIKTLPESIGSLGELLHIELGNSKIASLPQTFSHLKKLKYLGLKNTPLETIPDGVFASLRELRMLIIGNSYSNWKVGSGGVGVDIQELEKLKLLTYLDITVGNIDAIAWLSETPHLAASITSIYLKGCHGVKTINLPSVLGKGMESLFYFKILNSSDLEEVIVDDSQGEYALPEIKKVVIKNISKIKTIRIGSKFLDNLRVLSIKECNTLEQLIDCRNKAENEEDVSSSVSLLPNLKKFVLRSLPELKNLSHDNKTLTLPELEIVEVTECPKLKKFTLDAEELKTIKCEGSWWDQLDWDDETTKAHFQSLLDFSD